MDCVGTEAHLLDCDSIGVGSFCFHTEDASVKCRGKGHLKQELNVSLGTQSRDAGGKVSCRDFVVV